MHMRNCSLSFETLFAYTLEDRKSWTQHRKDVKPIQSTFICLIILINKTIQYPVLFVEQLIRSCFHCVLVSDMPGRYIANTIVFGKIGSHV